MIRIGHGYDVHRLAAGRALVLGGIEIPSVQGLIGWSDADVLTHAVMDALLGAVAAGDIGTHFPPGDPQYKGVSSLILLGQVKGILDGGGWRIGNIDATVVAEQPKLNPHIPAMCAKLAEALALKPGQISIKASTSEQMGFCGREEGMAAWAVALVEKG